MIAIIHWVLLVLLGFTALYMFAFSVASLFFRPRCDVKELSASADAASQPSADTATPSARRFIVLIPAYKSDAYIADTVRAACAQDYPRDRYRVLVIADTMQDATLAALPDLGAEVLSVSFEQSSKAKSLQQAMAHLGPDAADNVVILDADNIVRPAFLSQLDAVLSSGAVAVQAHRMAKNADTPVALIDAVSEEINNAIFRKGHCACGLSSALIGSGMAFPYDWFAARVNDFVTTGEDKEMELALLEDGLYVDYAPAIPVLDEKTRTAGNYSRQRRRWLGSQYHLFGAALRRLPRARLKAGFLDKVVQWMLVPRMIEMVLLPLCAILFTLLRVPGALCWWVLLVLLVLALVLGIPRSYLDRRLLTALLQVPRLALAVFCNFFHLKGTKSHFIHTDHQ